MDFFEDPQILISGIVGFFLATVFLLPIYGWWIGSSHAKEKKHLCDKIKSTESRLKEIEGMYKDAQKKIEELREKMNSVEEDFKIEGKKRKETEEKIESLEKENAALNRALSEERNCTEQEKLKSRNLENSFAAIARELGCEAKVGAEIEHVVSDFKKELQRKDRQIEDFRGQVEKLRAKYDEIQKELGNELRKRSIAEEKLFKITVLEKENRELRHELLELKTSLERITFQEKQIQEIKAVYSEETRERAAQKFERFAGQIFEIKVGLEKAIDAFNRTVGLLDNRYLIGLEPQVQPDPSETAPHSEIEIPKAIENAGPILPADHIPEGSEE